MAKMDEEFLYQIFSIIEEIPQGKVATYGQIARLAGYEKNSRLVGKALSISSYYGKFPCHRIVNANGRCVIGWDEQRGLLVDESVCFKENGCVDLKVHQWEQE